MSNVFQQMKKYNCEELYFKLDQKTGLRAIIAINSTKRGNMCSGGVRMRDYQNEDEALWDAFNLSLAMTQKCAAINARVGGGKAVLWGAQEKKTPAMLESFARFMCSLGGKFRTAVDLGLDFEDGQVIKRICPLVEGQPVKYGGLGTEGDTTAYGVIRAMNLAVKYVLEKDSLENLSIAVQGLGNVGGYMIEFLVKEGANLIVADIDENVIKQIKDKFPDIVVVPPDEILSVECDVLAPCAIGGVLNEDSISKLKCKVVCGCANNQLYNPELDSQLLEDRGIFYVPDFIANAGGILQAIVEMRSGTKEEAMESTRVIEENMKWLITEYEKGGKTTLNLANQLVEERLK